MLYKINYNVTRFVVTYVYICVNYNGIAVYGRFLFSQLNEFS